MFTSKKTKGLQTSDNICYVNYERLKDAYEIFLQGKIDGVSMNQRLQSYLGILSHANQHALSQAVKNAYWVRNMDFFLCLH